MTDTGSHKGLITIRPKVAAETGSRVRWHSSGFQDDRKISHEVSLVREVVGSQPQVRGVPSGIIGVKTDFITCV